MKNKVLFWGIGKNCKAFFELYEVAEDIVAFVDNDEEKRGTMFYNTHIEMPDRIKEWDFETVVIATGKYEKEIMNECTNDLKVTCEVITLKEYLKRGLIKGDS